MIKLEIVTPQGKIYSSEDIRSVTIPTTTGVITVLEDHKPLLSVLRAGEIIIENTKKQVTTLAVSSGLVHVIKDSQIQILADTAERAEEIDLSRAEEARKRAEEYLQEQGNVEDIEYARLQAKIEKELARIRVARKYKRLRIDT